MPRWSAPELEWSVAHLKGCCWDVQEVSQGHLRSLRGEALPGGVVGGSQAPFHIGNAFSRSTLLQSPYNQLITAHAIALALSFAYDDQTHHRPVRLTL
eukprot:1194951-Prorocentrum_minimum.AAC.5